MKKLLFAFGLLLSLLGKAQTVTIPDPNFAAWIQGNYPTCISGNQLDTACINNLNIIGAFIQSPNVINLSGIEFFVDLQNLFVYGNINLSVIPSLPNSLKKLNCSYNTNLSSLPILPNSITHLECYTNYFNSLPVFPNSLTVLTLTGGNFSGFPSLPNSLINLQIADNPNLINFPSLPSSLIDLSCYNNINLTNLSALPNSLISLTCTYNPNLTNLPSLPNSLQTLICNNNNLTSLPALPNSILTLDCSNNNLSNLPPLSNSLGKLTCDNNNLTSLPNLPNFLGNLSCNNNNLTSLPTLPNSIWNLSCNTNNLTSLPTLPNSLVVLSCNDNNLNSLPALPNSLYKFYCNKNNLSSLPTLPNSIYELYCLSNNLTNLPTLPGALFYFNCDSNQLVNLPILPNLLRYLYCSNNNLTSLPAIPNSLDILYCNYNNLSTLPTLSNLSRLSCNNNNLTSLPSLHPYYLTSLNCANNNITYILNLPDSLNSLDLSNNPNLTCLPNIPYDLVGFNITGTSITCLPNSFSSPTSLPICQFSSPNNPNNCPAVNISGTVYSDFNNDCLNNFEPSVYGIPIQIINNSSMSSQQSNAYTNSGFSFIDIPFGTYTVKPDSIPGFLISCTPSHTITLNPANPDTTNLNFGLQCKPNTFDLGVKSVVPVGPIFPGQQHELNIQAGDLSQLFNLYCSATQNISANLTVNVSGPVQFVGPKNGALTPTSVLGNVLTYAISNISTTNLFSSFNSIFTTDTTAQAGDSVCVMVSITTTQSGDVDPLNNTLKFCYLEVNSYDPNIKVVNREVVKPNFSDWLTYTIYFQNTGNAPAYNIKLVDTLDNALDLNTFEVIGYSHQNSFILNSNSRRLQVSYPNILLPDSFSNPLGSIGYVQYRIKPSAPMALNAQIKNKAGIYFDFNAPIITNTVTTTATNSVGLVGIKNTTEVIQLQPNPASQSLQVTLEKGKMDYISITELSGKVLLKKKINVGDRKIYFDLSEIENGLYLVNGYVGDKIVTANKLVVTK